MHPKYTLSLSVLLVLLAVLATAHDSSYRSVAALYMTLALTGTACVYSLMPFIVQSTRLKHFLSTSFLVAVAIVNVTMVVRAFFRAETAISGQDILLTHWIENVLTTFSILGMLVMQSINVTIEKKVQTFGNKLLFGIGCAITVYFVAYVLLSAAN